MQAFVFPGQGSQSVGMGQELLDTFNIYKHTLEEASDVLKRDIVGLIKEGPLTDTRNAQPTILAVSYATYRVIEEQMGEDPLKNVQFLAGHSLGEITALLVAGAFSFSDALKFVSFRAEQMAKASDGGMCAIIGLTPEAIEPLLTEHVYIANDNCIGQIVISGDKERVVDVSKACKAAGAKMVKMLDVSGPFHTPLMKPAREALEQYLDEITISPLKKQYYPNILAHLAINSFNVKDLLAKQVTGRVRWRETLIDMHEKGARTIVEVGPGKVLQGLVKRVDKEFNAISLNNPQDIENYFLNFQTAKV